MAKKKLKTFSVSIACDVPAYREVKVQATSARAAERQVAKTIAEQGYDAPYFNDNEPCFEEDWSAADNLRAVIDSAIEEKPCQN